MGDLERQLLEAQQDWLDLDDTENANLALSAVVRLRIYREALTEIVNYHGQYDGDGGFDVACYYDQIARQALKG